MGYFEDRQHLNGWVLVYEPQIGFDQTGQAAAMAGRVDFGTAETPNELLWMLRALRARWKLVVCVTLGLSGIATYVATSIAPLYTATATILIDPGETDYTNLGSAPGTRQGTVWPAELETYIKVLWSDQLAASVVRTVGLDAFRIEPSALRRIREQLAELTAPLMMLPERLLFTGSKSDIPRLVAVDADGPATNASSTSETERAIEVFRENLQVERDSLAAALSVTYRAANPLVAERVANAAAAAFPKELVRAQQSALAATTSYLNQRVIALQRELEAADGRTQALQNEISRPDGSGIARARFSEIIRGLSEAEAETTGIENDIAAAGNTDGAINDHLSTPALQALREQRLDIARAIAELGADVGERHPQMLALVARRNSVQASISEEESRIRGELQRSLHLNQARIAWLKSELATVETVLARGLDDEVKLRQLQTERDSTRQVYQDILARYQRASEQQQMVSSPARVINTAQKPQAPERRKIYMALAATTLGALAVGMALAILLELRRKGFQFSEDLAAATGQPVFGSLPLVASRSGRRLLGKQHADLRRHDYAEAVRRLALRLLPPGKQHGTNGIVVLVTSALPAEGKTVACLSIARQFAQTGHKVLLVDADLHKGMLQDLVDQPASLTGGLAGLLTAGSSTLEQFVVRDTRTSLDLLLAGRPGENPARLLASPGMSAVMHAARARYDVVVVDTPPILAVTDAAVIARFADRMALVVRWQSTPKSAVKLAVAEMRAFSTMPFGVVLNMIDLAAYVRSGGGDQLAYHHLRSGYHRA